MIQAASSLISGLQSVKVRECQLLSWLDVAERKQNAVLGLICVIPVNSASDNGLARMVETTYAEVKTIIPSVGVEELKDFADELDLVALEIMILIRPRRRLSFA